MKAASFHSSIRCSLVATRSPSPGPWPVVTGPQHLGDAFYVLNDVVIHGHSGVAMMLLVREERISDSLSSRVIPIQLGVEALPRFEGANHERRQVS